MSCSVNPSDVPTEVYVAGATRWRNPEDDLPADFETSRDVHYAELRQPPAASEFIAGLKQRMTTALDRFDSALANGAPYMTRCRSPSAHQAVREGPPSRRDRPVGPGGLSG